MYLAYIRKVLMSEASMRALYIAMPRMTAEQLATVLAQSYSHLGLTHLNSQVKG